MSSPALVAATCEVALNFSGCACQAFVVPRTPERMSAAALFHVMPGSVQPSLVM